MVRARVYFLPGVDPHMQTSWFIQKGQDAVFAQLRKYATIAVEVKLSFLDNPDRTPLDFPTPRTLMHQRAWPRE